MYQCFWNLINTVFWAFSRWINSIIDGIYSVGNADGLVVIMWPKYGIWNPH